MSDWDFLHEMHDHGYSPKDIADAAGSGAAPWEWEEISRSWLDAQLSDVPRDDATSIGPGRPFKSRSGAPFNAAEQRDIFTGLVDCAARHLGNTGRYLQIWGELGEIYAEVKFGLCRHATHSPGSDGTIDGRLVEVKTISPEKASDEVLVKAQGNFEQLLVVRISPDFQFQGKLFDRSELKKATKTFLKAKLKDESRTT